MPSGRRTFENKDEMVARARDLRKKGLTMDEIAADLGVTNPTISRWVTGVPKPRKPAKGAGRKLVATKKQELRGDRERNKIDVPDEDDAPANIRIVRMSGADEIDEYDTTGPLPDPQLIAQANGLLETWLDDKAEGRLASIPKAELQKARYVMCHALEVGTYDGFRENRDHWGATRDLAGLTTEEIANQVGVSSPTISRWELNHRHPDPTHHHNLFIAYQAALEQAMQKNEWALALESYTQAYRADNSLGKEEDFEFDGDHFLRWVTRGQDGEGFDIGHIDTLKDIRALLPRPTWREAQPQNLMLAGYSE